MDITRRQWLLQIGTSAILARWPLEVQARIEWEKYTHLLNASTNQHKGVPFRLSSAVLRLGLKDRYRGRISFHSSDPNAVLPPPYEFSPKDDLYESHLFEVTLKGEGKHTISLTDEKTGKTFASNVILVSGRDPKYKLYFGDIHIHSRWSVDGRGDPDYNYIYARDAMNLDFACLTEHDPTDKMWEKIKAKARDFYQPGRFATMAAYEWTGHELHEGHKNVYYRDVEGPVFRSNWLWEAKQKGRLKSEQLKYVGPPQTTSAADLWAKLRKSGKTAFTVPHHPASALFPVPWEHYDSEFQRCVEIYSSWGCSEYPGSPRQIMNSKMLRGPAPGHFVQDALALGQRVGFVGASDSHSGRPGYPGHWEEYADSDYSEWAPELYTGGFTGIYAEECSREAIFDAIQSRRCYATTGKRIVLHFKMNDHWMGEEVESDDAPHFFIKVIGTAPLDSVTLVKNGLDYMQREGSGSELEFEYGKTERPRNTDYYYVRVIQKDGEMAWASPIWISRRGTK